MEQPFKSIFYFTQLNVLINHIEKWAVVVERFRASLIRFSHAQGRGFESGHCRLFSLF